jgi:hypothetical protein
LASGGLLGWWATAAISIGSPFALKGRPRETSTAEQLGAA